MSKTGIRNLLAKTRTDSLSKGPRGLVNARPAKLVACLKKPHPRWRWSATLFKYDKQWIVSAATRGVKCFQLHGDDMCKIPIGIPARPGARIRGFGIQRLDGQPTFQELDHGFLISEKLLLFTTGWFL